MIKYISEFLVVTSLVVSTIQFLLFSLLGIDYDPEKGGGLVAILNITSFCISIVWVWWHEITLKVKHQAFWPYILVAFIIFSFFFESMFFPDLTLTSFAGKQFTFFGVMSVPAIFLATYVYRHEAYGMITRNIDIIMLISSIALILNIPTMLSSSAFQTIGGAGGHQEISYSAAWCFGINFTNILSGNTENRFRIFNSKFFRTIFLALLPIQAMICILGGGRGGGVLLILSFVVALYIYGRQHFWRTMFFAVLAVAAFSVIAITSGQFTDGFGRTFDYLTGNGIDLEQNMSDVERTQLREHSYQIIGKSPVLGYGLWHGLNVAGFYMHNIFLDILISGGIIYLLCTFYIFKKIICSIRILIKNKKMCTLLPIALLPATMLLFSGYYMSSALFWFTTIYGLLSYKQCKMSTKYKKQLNINRLI